ncbi:DUF4231 domain-containing protein [Leptolyngbya sp. FACHB-261]|uniref:DUF4231 domain-containing protein n=1 Tax=Leptolyngbya sp. FACHB-261 TaxID=2692806 RepID=UPI001685610B|nr:DUF4231 domain-containing protein [Leptolyngbya sp. FACHB-261]MBD2102838.1 DUF4231 domain-containing protein [Leptolyngbya sp. FACHB-261]
MVDQEPSPSSKQKEALDQCDHLIKNFAARADRNKLSYKRLQFISIALSISTTILSALSASKKLDQLDWTVPALSGLATLATTFLSQTNSQKMWVHSRSVAQRLQVEKFLYLQESGEYESLSNEDQRLKLFSKRVMNIWSEAQESWSQNVSSAK